MLYGDQNLRKYFTSILNKDKSLLACSYIGKLRNGRKIECDNKPFIVFILILKRSFVLDLIFYKLIPKLQPLGRTQRNNPKLEHRVGWSLIFKNNTRYKIRFCPTFRFFIIKSCCCCCCLHIKSRSGLYSVLSNIRTGPTDADAFRGHRLTTQKGYTYQKEIKGPRKVNTHAIIGK